jgi:hypothetical protein
MRLVDEIQVPYKDCRRSVRLYVGDLAHIPAKEAVDLLVVSAFPNSYFPSTTSLVGALHRRGVSVASLATKKAVDLRQFSSCWLSEEVDQPGINFRRILCFEPACEGSAAEVVGDVFRSIVPFTTGSPPIKTLAMPILASGDQGNSASAMLQALLEASIHWLGIGLPLESIKIVAFGEEQLGALRRTFTQAKETTKASKPPAASRRWEYDAFISYSHQNRDDVDSFVENLLRSRPGARLFVDRLELQPGCSWQQKLYEVIDECAKVIPFLSPQYVESKVCKEEFNIAFYRHREAEEGVLLPVYLLSAQLPTYMKLAQWVDCREAERGRIAEAAKEVSRHL